MLCTEPGCPVLAFGQRVLELLRNPLGGVGCFLARRHRLREPPELERVVHVELLH